MANTTDLNERGPISAALRTENGVRETLSVHWRAVFAGVFVAELVYIVLLTLGLAIGAMQVSNLIQGTGSARALGSGFGIWMVITVVLSLFAGSYAAGRASGIVATRVGYIQGAVISSLFFIMMLSQIGFSVGMIGAGLTNLTSKVAGQAAQVADTTRTIDLVEDVIGDLHFRSSPDVVMAGVLSRLQRGDRESALNYIASQANISKEEATARFNDLNNRFQILMSDLGTKSAQAARWLGFSAFSMLLLGSVAALIGGAFGAQMNMRKPWARMDRAVFGHQMSPAHGRV